MHFDTVMSVREVNNEPTWEILFNDKGVYDYNLSEVLDAQEIQELNKDYDNNDKDNEYLPPPLPAKKCKNKPKEKKKSKANKKCKKKANDDDNSVYSHGNYDPGKPYVYNVDYYESDKSYDYLLMDIGTKQACSQVLSPKRCQSLCGQSM